MRYKRSVQVEQPCLGIEIYICCLCERMNKNDFTEGRVHNFE
ncbi:MAG: hypothetical protein Harvfovirus87_5, partial [Harvfovirus sp.]